MQGFAWLPGRRVVAGVIGHAGAVVSLRGLPHLDCLVHRPLVVPSCRERRPVRMRTRLAQSGQVIWLLTWVGEMDAQCLKVGRVG